MMRSVMGNAMNNMMRNLVRNVMSTGGVTSNGNMMRKLSSQVRLNR